MKKDKKIITVVMLIFMQSVMRFMAGKIFSSFKK